MRDGGKRANELRKAFSAFSASPVASKTKSIG
jgi:hypothetical protein